MSGPLDVKGSVAIIGSGIVGRSWTMLFAAANYRVRLYDVMTSQLDNAVDDIYRRLGELESQNLLRGNRSASEQSQLITGCEELEKCVQGVVHVQECVPESVDVKRSVFAQLDSLCPPEVVLGSSTSAIPCSEFTQLLEHRHRCIVVHPVNPPYYMPLVELVPAPWTSPEVLRRTRELITDLGQSPVTLNKEVAGFVQPRLQYAIIMQCLRLVQDDVLSVDDVDLLMTHALGLHYSFVGPFELLHTSNDEGFDGFLRAEGSTVDGIVAHLGDAVRMESSSALMRRLFDRLAARTPLDQLAARRRWRDDRLAALAQLRRHFNNHNDDDTVK